jgi:hypothetical protein
MKLTKSILTLAVASIGTGLFSIGQAQAAATLYKDASNTSYITALTQFATLGNMMDGMSVTAYFGSGGSETRTWQDTGTAGMGGAFGTGWSLTLAGDSFNSSWLFDFNSPTGAAPLLLTKLVLNGDPGLTVFDRTFLGSGFPAPEEEGTFGSALGRDFTFSGNETVDVTYANAVALAATAPVLDIWYSLTIDFGPNGIRTDFSFVQDTDNVVSRVPEPASLALFGAGLLGLGFSRRRKS